MAKTGTRTRRGPSAKAMTGSKGNSAQSKRSGGGGAPGQQGLTAGKKSKGRPG